ncbi:MAG TPA: methyltransferase domain-containing protein [Gaiellales bacterium]|nr:methyltransferase domain-containing protein [Gaiellales bacterium]
MNAVDPAERPAVRYDGHAEWYDEHLAVRSGERVRSPLARLLGTGPGRCLDLCCGTGIHLGALSDLGWSVTGLDLSADQLRVARRRTPDGRVRLVQGDAMRMPFPDGSFDAVVSFFSHTDVDDFPALVRETARVLRAGGAFVYIGLHPCFVGPHSLEKDRDVPLLHPGYRAAGRFTRGPGISPDGLWARVSGNHLPLASVIQPLLDSGFALERFEEHGDEDYPRRIALRTLRAARRG